jgi:predicted HTH domain antitoxin
MSVVPVDMEEELVSLLTEANPSAAGAAREMIVLELYRRGAVSSGKASGWLGMSRQDFIQHASGLGIPYLDATAAEWQAELAASKAL